MTREIKRCTKCGEAFETSRTGFTVKCPACRAARRERRTRTAGFATTAAARHEGRTCTVVVGAGHRRCGKAAVTAFTTAAGETFAECAEHVR